MKVDRIPANLTVIISDTIQAWVEEPKGHLDFQEFLQFLQGFESVDETLRNKFLVYLQNPKATRVATEAQWRAQRVRLSAQAKPIRVIANDSQSKIPDYGNPLVVFDVSDTSLSVSQEVLDLDDAEFARIVKVSNQRVASNRAEAVFNKRSIYIFDRDSLPERLQTFVFQWCLNLMRDKQIQSKAAESVSYLVSCMIARNYGVDDTIKKQRWIDAFDGDATLAYHALRLTYGTYLQMWETICS